MQHVKEVILACNKAEKEWTDHMKQPNYCLNKNYILYKKYIRYFNLLQQIDIVMSTDNPQDPHSRSISSVVTHGKDKSPASKTQNGSIPRRP